MAEFLASMDWQIMMVLGLLVLALVLFSLETISVDLVTLLMLIGLVGFGILTPAEAFAGFSNDIIIIIASIFVLSAALQQTGVMDATGTYILKVAGHSRNRLLVILMAVVGGMSMFVNNTTATAVFIPPTMSVAKRIAVSPSKLLMPLAYASILGGTATLIGTSTNVAVSGFIAQNGMEPISLFELLPVGLVILGVGILYMWVFNRRLLPDYPDDSLTEEYAIRRYLTEVALTPDSHLIGQRIFDSDLSRLDFQILAVLRGNRKFRPNSRSKFEAGDTLLVQGKVDDLIQIKETAGLDIQAEQQFDMVEGWAGESDNEQLKLAELLIIPKSDLIGRTLRSTNFRQRYGLTVLALYRHGHPLGDKIKRVQLKLGDMLLVQGPTERLEFLRRSQDFWILEELSPRLDRKRRGLYAIGLLVAAVVVGGAGWLPLSVAFLAAAVLAILLRCITTQEAYEFVDWRLIILIGGMTAFGLAMEKSGAAQLLAHWVIFGLQPLGIVAVMTGFAILTVLLTQPMSNAAAALVVLPVALQAAHRLEVNPRTFAIAVMLAASVAVITPFEPSCILVYGPGKYRFFDFVKTGIGLTMILIVIVLMLIPVFWPL